jgi:tRNA(Ile)-lysidine synthase
LELDIVNKLESAVKDSLSDTTEASEGEKPRIIAAVSGGADSTAMLAALVTLREQYEIFCVHVNHKLRGEESDMDAEAVERQCKIFDIPFILETAAKGEIVENAKNLGCGIEAAARTVRYTALRKNAKKLNTEKILTAHNKDDAMENVLMRILRGAGPAGLSGIRSERNLLRPLINITREEILSYLKIKNINYRTDSTNSDDSYYRNRVRLYLIPVLNEYFPSWEKGITSLAQTQLLVSSYLRNGANRIIRNNRNTTNYNQDSIMIKDFFYYPDIIKEEILFCVLNNFNIQIIPKRETIRNALRREKSQVGESDRERWLDLGKARIQFIQNDAIISLKKHKVAKGFSFLIQKEGYYQIEGIIIDCNKKSAKITIKGKVHNIDTIKFPFVLYKDDRNGNELEKYCMQDAKGNNAHYL